MSTSRAWMRVGLVVALPAMWLLDYFLVYLSILVPRMPGWHAIPIWIQLLRYGTCAAVLAAIGTLSGPREVVAPALFLTLVHWLIGFQMQRHNMPGYGEAEFDDPIFNAVALPVVALFFAGAMLLGVLARRLVRLRLAAPQEQQGQGS